MFEEQFHQHCPNMPVHKGREFVRHPAHIAIEVQATNSAKNIEYLDNVSLGGMALHSDVCWEPGSVLNIRVPVTQPPIELTGKVVWCHQHKEHFDVGIQFIESNNKVEIGNMVDEVCQVEMYKQMIIELVNDPIFWDEMFV